MEIVQREPRSLECEWRNDIERNRIGETDTCGRLIEWDACCSATDGWASPPPLSRQGPFRVGYWPMPNYRKRTTSTVLHQRQRRSPMPFLGMPLTWRFAPSVG